MTSSKVEEKDGYSRPRCGRSFPHRSINPIAIFQFQREKKSPSPPRSNLFIYSKFFRRTREKEEQEWQWRGGGDALCLIMAMDEEGVTRARAIADMAFFFSFILFRCGAQGVVVRPIGSDVRSCSPVLRIQALGKMIHS